jgi:hypothetical protein
MTPPRALRATADKVRLDDGARLAIRPVEPDDKALFADAFAHLSDESRYPRLPDAAARARP